MTCTVLKQIIIKLKKFQLLIWTYTHKNIPSMYYHFFMFTTCVLTNTASATSFKSNIFCFVTHYVNFVLILFLVVTRTLKSSALHL